VPEHDHSFDRHVPHRVIDSTEVETGVSVASDQGNIERVVKARKELGIT
jgi:hypothetical protein